MRDDVLRMESVPCGFDGCLILRLAGPLVLQNIFEFQSLARADKSHCLIVDMAEVPYVDSAGIGALVGACVSHQRDGNRLALAAVNQRVRQALEITRVDTFFTMFPSTEEAEQSLGNVA